MNISGCSTVVVYSVWDREIRVRFSAPRQVSVCGISLVVELQFSKLLARVRFSYPAQKKKSPDGLFLWDSEQTALLT